MGSQARDYMIAAQHETLTHDLDGNLAADSLWTYTYDAENRLVRMTSLLPAGQGFTRRGRERAIFDQLKIALGRPAIIGPYQAVTHYRRTRVNPQHQVGVSLHIFFRVWQCFFLVVQDKKSRSPATSFEK